MCNQTQIMIFTLKTITEWVYLSCFPVKVSKPMEANFCHIRGKKQNEKMKKWLTKEKWILVS